MRAGISHSIIAVNSTTPTRVTPVDEPSNLRANIMVQNLGAADVYFGAENLTASSYGVALSAGDFLSVDDLPNSFDVFALSTETTCNLAVLVTSYA